MIKLFIQSPIKDIFFQENKFFVESTLQDCDLVISENSESIKKALALDIPVLKPSFLGDILDVNMSFVLRQPSLKRSLNFALRNAVSLVASLKKIKADPNFWQERRKTVVLFCLEGLSSYILFRNTIPHLLEKYDLILVSALESKEFIELYDKESFKDIVYIDTKKLENKLGYLSKTLKKLSLLKSHFLLNTAFSHTEFTRVLTLHTNATSKVMIKGNLANIDIDEYYECLNLYNRVLDTGTCINFEHYRYINMVKAFLNADLKIDFELMDIKEDSIKDKDVLTFKDKSYILVSLESSLPEKRYKHFDKVLRELLEVKKDLKIVLCGSEKDLKVCTLTHPNITNLVGKLDLASFIFLLQNSLLNVVNNHAPAHLSNALNKPTLILANGDNLGRFSKYPRELRPNSKTLYEDAIEENFNGVKLFSNLGLIKPYVAKKYNVSDISPSKVVSSILMFLK
ncbi:glycosyltransferase family 9 protein [Helicobacter sp. 11S02629-2]|uniref:glycosyltransferase family 9 protein n=1 Tax=Helicobacter sp. 11S02629-2 TaxID=1476195 RepID=UPI000BA69A8B|nr:glycosyltransferase family 9 protein [Helicobacter sp. 11S02629-2]PAF46052.1 hypothetical protein BKH40_01195 [Helicobacter sp. 11S02629-2]